MGLWDTLKSVAWEANESAHSERLNRDLFPTMHQVDLLPDHLKEKAYLRFLELRATVLSQIANWSRDGVLKTAKEFSSEARKLQNFDRCNSLGFALAALWLESSARMGEKADSVFHSLDELANSLHSPLVGPEFLSDGKPQSILEKSESVSVAIIETPKNNQVKENPKRAVKKRPKSTDSNPKIPYSKPPNPVDKFEPLAAMLGKYGSTQNNLFNTLLISGCPNDLARVLANRFGKSNAS